MPRAKTIPPPAHPMRLLSRINTKDPAWQLVFYQPQATEYAAVIAAFREAEGLEAEALILHEEKLARLCRSLLQSVRVQAASAENGSPARWEDSPDWTRWIDGSGVFDGGNAVRLARLLFFRGADPFALADDD